MILAYQHLRPIVETITELLVTPEELQRFEAWAMAWAQPLRRSAECGVSCLAREAAVLRDELARLSEVSHSPTAEAGRLRLCQQLWLTGLAGFVDELLVEEQAAEPHPWPTESAPAADDDLELCLGDEGSLVEVAEALPGHQPHRVERLVERRS